MADAPDISPEAVKETADFLAASDNDTDRKGAAILLALREALTAAEAEPANGAKLDVIRRAYEWALTVDGEVWGLTAGDMGYEHTGIVIDPEHLEASKTAVTAAEARAEAAEAALAAERERADRLEKALRPFGCECSGRCEQMEWLPAGSPLCVSARARVALGAQP